MAGTLIRFPIVVCLALLAGRADAEPEQAAAFGSVEEAVTVLREGGYSEKEKAVRYLQGHPEEARPKLMTLILEKDKSWDAAMRALTGIGDDHVFPFYCDLLEKHRYELDEKGERKVYGFGSPHGCEVSPYEYGRALVLQLGRLGEGAADLTLQKVWPDCDPVVKAAIPLARYQIGTLSREELFRLAKTDEGNRELYVATLREIARELGYQEGMQAKANEILEAVDALPGISNETRTSVHMSLLANLERAGEFERALTSCDWVIGKSENKEFAKRCALRRPILQYHQGELTLDDLFEQAARKIDLYDRIAQIGRSGKVDGLALFDRIIEEAPGDSKYGMEARYWKMEFYSQRSMEKEARQVAEFLLANCEEEHVLGWVRRRMAQ